MYCRNSCNPLMTFNDLSFRRMTNSGLLSWVRSRVRGSAEFRSERSSGGNQHRSRHQHRPQPPIPHHYSLEIRVPQPQKLRDERTSNIPTTSLPEIDLLPHIYEEICYKRVVADPVISTPGCSPTSPSLSGVDIEDLMFDEAKRFGRFLIVPMKKKSEAVSKDVEIAAPTAVDNRLCSSDEGRDNGVYNSRHNGRMALRHGVVYRQRGDRRSMYADNSQPSADDSGFSSAGRTSPADLGRFLGRRNSGGSAPCDSYVQLLNSSSQLGYAPKPRLRVPTPTTTSILYGETSAPVLDRRTPSDARTARFDTPTTRCSPVSNVECNIDIDCNVTSHQNKRSHFANRVFTTKRSGTAMVNSDEAILDGATPARDNDTPTRDNDTSVEYKIYDTPSTDTVPSNHMSAFCPSKPSRRSLESSVYPKSQDTLNTSASLSSICSLPVTHTLNTNKADSEHLITTYDNESPVSRSDSGFLTDTEAKSLSFSERLSCSSKVWPRDVPQRVPRLPNNILISSPRVEYVL